MHDHSPADPLDERGSARTNLLLAATLRIGGASHAVKIRDLSPAGAQIESALIPEVGQATMLVRGRLSIEGHVSWSASRRFGVHFVAPLSVAEWMAKPTNRRQERVDALVAIVRASALPPVAPAEDDAGTAYGIAEDLQRLSRLLESLGDRLVSDPQVAARHGDELQSLDIALQTLAALAHSIEFDAGQGGSGRARLDSLRVSSAEALRGG